MDGDDLYKQKYQKYKLRVKLWEKDFKKRKGRIPSKYDIREATEDIRYSYRMYYKLKTSFLEDTLNDALADDGFDISTVTEDAIDNEEIESGPQLPLDISAIVGECNQSMRDFSNLPTISKTNDHCKIVNVNEDHVIKHFDAVDELALNTKSWGTNVSKQHAAQNTLERKPSFKSNLSHKLFKSNSFSIRNPRKSLSRSTFGSSTNVAGNLNSNDTNANPDEEVLPDLELILLKKAKEQQNESTITANPLLVGNNVKTGVKTNVDRGWLERTATQNGLKPSTLKPVAENTESKSSFGLSNIDLTKIKTMHNSTADTEEIPNSPLPQHLAHESIAAACVAPKSEQKKTVTYDSDSVVSDSGDEETPQNTRHIVKKRRLLNAGDGKQNKAISANTLKPVQSNAIVEVSSKNANIDHVSDLVKQAEVANHKTLDDPNTVKAIKDENTKTNTRTKRAIKKVPKAMSKSKSPRTSTKKSPKTTSKTSPKTAAKRTSRTRSSKRNVEDANENVENIDEIETKPLDPAQLKYTIALDSGDVVSVPRVKSNELQNAQAVAEQYISRLLPSMAAGTSQKATTLPVNEKRATERRKLEEKIASGRLNENYRTINIQKKLFVRGKKTVNYSKYKKKQWRDKKRVAALTGPNMDMGGCDGGVLRCFNCGQTGHFAQQCKLKGDGLLPLTAQLAEDPSPFPTLEEAEQMATERAVVVHSRNISKLPQASNTAIYRKANMNEAITRTPNESDELTDFAPPNDCTDTNANDCDKGKQDDEDVNEDESDTDKDDGDDGEKGDEDENLFDTDDEFEGIDIEEAIANAAAEKIVDTKMPEELLQQTGLSLTANGTANSASIFPEVGPLYALNEDGSTKAVTTDVLEVLHMFGHSSFRKGQDRAVMRILSGQSTLVTLSTGSGKSLCYQLPAYLYSRTKRSITLVISPLVSLMEDQVTGVPSFLRAHCLHTNQTPQQRSKVLKMIGDGEVDILLVSPEAVVAGERSTGFGSILRQLPPIAFACIDEAHCVSQWSHNFRPSYLMICKVLRKNLGVHTILGLTATATVPTRLSIINHLGIADGERGVISDVPLPDNLTLSVSKDEHRDAALLQLLLSERFNVCNSIIIYCTRRDECERIATFLRTSMQDQKAPTTTSNKRKRINWHAEPYHAGMASSRRRTIQNAFMRNELRIVVATIAFGMGINKPDIRSVIHYNMPRNFESYVQEIGRAGRDGHESHCHMFLDARGNDQNELRRHIYANSIDRHVIRKLLQRVFVPCACTDNLNTETSRALNATQSKERICKGHEIGFSIEQTVEYLDIPEENISTLLCYLELDSQWNINILSSAYIMAKVISYGGAKYLKYAAKECAPLAMAVALKIKKGTFDENANIIEFSVIDIASAIGWNSGVVKYQLKNLEWIQVNGQPQRSPINVNFYDLGFRLRVPGDFLDDEIDNALDTLYSRSVKQEQTQLVQLQYVFKGLSSVAYNSYVPCASKNYSLERSNQLKGFVRDYFQNDYPIDFKVEIEDSCDNDDYITNDINAIINMYPDNNFSGRNIARIFYGISSPNFPAVIWGRCKFWRVHCKKDFNRLVQMANAIIIQRRM